MDVVWLNRFKLNRFETGLSASVNRAIERFLQLLLEYADIFAKEGELGRTDKIKHNIDTSMLDQSDSPSAGCLCARGES